MNHLERLMAGEGAYDRCYSLVAGRVEVYASPKIHGWPGWKRLYGKAVHDILRNLNRLGRIRFVHQHHAFKCPACKRFFFHGWVTVCQFDYARKTLLCDDCTALAAGFSLDEP